MQFSKTPYGVPLSLRTSSTGSLVGVRVRGSLCDTYTICQESHYLGALNNSPIG